MTVRNGITMMKRDNWTIRAFGILVISIVAFSVAAAGSLTQYKADGLIGEQASGYIGIVSQNAPAEVKSLVAEVNARRKAGYQDIARKQGTRLEDVEKVGGNKTIEKTLRGNYVKDAGGSWRKK
jgi:uncharacterized protein YdbL (DUF1318 family)